MRAWLPWIIWLMVVVVSIGALVLHKNQVISEQFGYLCLVVIAGLIGDIMLCYTFLGSGGSWLFRRKTIRLFGETLCRVIEGSVGVILVMGSLFFLFMGATHLNLLLDPSSPAHTEGSHEVKLLILLGGSALVLLFSILVAIMAFAGPGRVPVPSPPPESTENHGQDTFNF